jgi:hypothetical protein
MKQAKLLALTISLVLLCACSRGAKYGEVFQNWRAGFLVQETYEIEAVVTAVGAETVCDYSLLFTEADGVQAIEVLAPELIARVRAQIEDGETSLRFDGAILETGTALTEGFSPLMSLPILMEALREGHHEASWRESGEGGELLVVTELELKDGTILSLWQEGAELRPIYADLRRTEKTELKLTFTKFS